MLEVMCYNVYCMATYSCGNYVTKPYISSSNYIIKMSNYKKDNNWNMLNKHQTKFKKIPRLGMLLHRIPPVFII